MKHQSYFLGEGMEDFLNFIRNVTPCTFLFMFAKIAMAKKIYFIDVIMAWTLMAIAFYGVIASVWLFILKMHVHYRAFSFSPEKDSYPGLMRSTIMKVIEVVGLFIFILSISFFTAICISLANKGANEYLLFIGSTK